MGSALKFKQSQVPRQQGEQARLKVVQGPDYGSIYVLTGARVTVGRGEDNDVIISDLKASRRHVELAMGVGTWTIKDLGSANGIIFNGKTVRNGNIKSGDTIQVGETTLEFQSSEQGTMFLVAPPKSLGQIQQEQGQFEAQRQRVKQLGAWGALNARYQGEPQQAPAAQPQDKKKMLMMGAAVAVGLFLFFGMEEEPPKKPAKKAAKKVDARDLASFLPGAANDSSGTGQTASQFFWAGFREYRERNYLRAKSQFETVLQMQPGHAQATHYLNKCNQDIDETVKDHLEAGKKAMSAGKLRESKGNFEAVMRLLYRDQTSPAFIEAKDQLDQVRKLMKGEGGPA